MVKALEKFNLENLESISKAQVSLSNLLLHYTEGLPSAKSFESAIATAIQDFTTLPFSLSVSSIAFKSSSELIFKKSEYRAFFSQISLPPSNQGFVLEVENSLFKTLTYSLLGTEANETTKNSKPSEVERGIFSFILLKILAQLEQMIDELPGKLQLTSNSSDLSDLQATLETSHNVSIISLTVRLGDQASYVKIIIPESLLRHYLGEKNATSKDNPNRLPLALRRAIGIQTPVSTHLGKIPLSDDDLQNLDVDDIILLDQSSVTLNDDTKSVTGTVESSIGDPNFGSLKSEISVSNQGHYKIKIVDFATHMASNIKPYSKNKEDLS